MVPWKSCYNTTTVPGQTGPFDKEWLSSLKLNEQTYKLLILDTRRRNSVDHLEEGYYEYGLPRFPYLDDRSFRPSGYKASTRGAPYKDNLGGNSP